MSSKKNTRRFPGLKFLVFGIGWFTTMNTNWSLISSILFDTLPEFQKSIHKILDKEKGAE